MHIRTFGAVVRNGISVAFEEVSNGGALDGNFPVNEPCPP